MSAAVDVVTPPPSEDVQPKTDDVTSGSSDSDAEPTDSEYEEEGGDCMCPSLSFDHRLQRALFELEDEDETQEAVLDEQGLSQYLEKFKDDMCGWIPDPKVQYRRQVVDEKRSSPKGGRTNPKHDPFVGNAVFRRLILTQTRPGTIYGQGGQQKAPPSADYDFRHFNNYRKYCEQYRRFHTCGGALQKLTRSALGGRTRTIYYAGDATAEAGVDVTDGAPNSFQPGLNHIRRTGPAGPGLGSDARRTTAQRNPERPSIIGQPVVCYSDMSVNSPRFNLLGVDASYPRTRTQYSWPPNTLESETELLGKSELNTTNHASSINQTTAHHRHQNFPKREQTLTVHTSSKPPRSLPTVSAPTASPPAKPHLPFFPSQQPLRQVHTYRHSLTPPSSNLVNDPLLNGYSLDRCIGAQAGPSTGISQNQPSHRDFYSQLVHAAQCLSLVAKPPQNFELPRWPTYISQSEILPTSGSPQDASQPKKFPKMSPPSSISKKSPNQPKEQGLGTSQDPAHQQSGSSSRSCKQQNAQKLAPICLLENPTSATKDTHYINIEPPTCSPFDTKLLPCTKNSIPDETTNRTTTSYRVTLKKKPTVNVSLKNPTSATKETHYITIEPPGSSLFDAKHRKGELEPEKTVCKTASYSMSLKDKSVLDLKDKSSVEMVADANRALAVCEVTWF